MPGPACWPGVPGIDAITLFDTTDFSIKIGGEVKNFVPED